MRKLFIILICCTIVGVAGYAGHRTYKVWKQKHLLSMAREFYAKADGKNAQLSLRQALAVNPMNVDANRLAAEVAQAARSPEALIWRSRVVELNPKSTDDRLALAETAMIYHDYGVGTNALEGVSAEGKKTAAYHNIAGALAAAANQVAEAKAHFQEAIRLEPQNASLQLNLAVVEIHGTNDPSAAEARASLQRLSLNQTNANLRCQALRELVIDAARNKHNESALALSGELLRQTNANFPDRLLRLEVLQAAQSTEFKSTMTAFEKEASTNSGRIYELATWQETHGAVPEGLAWLQSLPPDIRTNQPVALLVAEFHNFLKDWRGLQRALEHQDWQTSDFLRHAFLSRALRGQELTDSAKVEWEQALRAASGQKMSRTMLVRLAASWGWQSETEELLWTIINQYPSEKWADQALTQILFAGGRTQSLLQLFSQELKRTPSDLAAKNNLAMTAMLLDAKELKPYDLAREVHEQAPTNSFFAATYAYSLYLQGKKAEALKVMQQLKPQDLDRPATAGYYGIILKATGDAANAKVYLDKTTKGAFLPEEKKLFAQARGGS